MDTLTRLAIETLHKSQVTIQLEYLRELKGWIEVEESKLKNSSLRPNIEE